MKLTELRQLIIDSDVSSWNVIPAGPYFTDAPNIDDDTFEQHGELLVFVPDVDLTIQAGMRARGRDHIEDATSLWGDVVPFADPTVRVEYVDVFWRGVLVDRSELVVVDGGRAVIPLGSQQVLNWTDHSEPAPDKFEFSYSATTYEAALARVVDRDREWSEYMDRAKMKIVDG